MAEDSRYPEGFKGRTRSQPEKADIEAYSGDWLLKYNDLEQRLELVRGILNKYPRCEREVLPTEKVEILLSDMQELHSITSEGYQLLEGEDEVKEW